MLVGARVSLVNSNHFYNQVLMRTFPSVPKIYTYPRPKHFKKQGGASAGSSFEQIRAQRLTGVPSPISGGTGWVGSRWAGIWNPHPKHSNAHMICFRIIVELLFIKIAAWNLINRVGKASFRLEAESAAIACDVDIYVLTSTTQNLRGKSFRLNLNVLAGYN